MGPEVAIYNKQVWRVHVQEDTESVCDDVCCCEQVWRVHVYKDRESAWEDACCCDQG